MVPFETAAAADPPVPIARAWVDAILAHRFGELDRLLQPDVAFRALVPRGLREATTSADAIGWVERWFGDADAIAIQDLLEGTIADRSWLRYRLLAHKPEGWMVIEQQVYVTVADDRIARLDLLCSGFRPAEAHGENKTAQEPDAVLDAVGADCATLIPTLARSVNSLPAGGVLDLVTDDPTAGPSLDAWARLTGHQVLANAPEAADTRDSASHWLIRRKDS